MFPVLLPGKFFLQGLCTPPAARLACITQNGSSTGTHLLLLSRLGALGTLLHRCHPHIPSCAERCGSCCASPAVCEPLGVHKVTQAGRELHAAAHVPVYRLLERTSGMFQCLKMQSGCLWKARLPSRVFRRQNTLRICLQPSFRRKVK